MTDSVRDCPGGDIWIVLEELMTSNICNIRGCHAWMWITICVVEPAVVVEHVGSKILRCSVVGYSKWNTATSWRSLVGSLTLYLPAVNAQHVSRRCVSRWYSMESDPLPSQNLVLSIITHHNMWKRASIVALKQHVVRCC